MAEERTELDKLMELKLHGMYHIGSECYVMRVIGGFIYMFYGTRSTEFEIVATQFVPDTK